MDINGCEDNPSQILHLLSREEAKGNATNNSCSKKVRMPSREISHSVTENSEKGKESNSTKKQERQRNILKPSRKAEFQ